MSLISVFCPATGEGQWDRENLKQQTQKPQCGSTDKNPPVLERVLAGGLQSCYDFPLAEVTLWVIWEICVHLGATFGASEAFVSHQTFIPTVTNQFTWSLSISQAVLEERTVDSSCRCSSTVCWTEQMAAQHLLTSKPW